MTRIDASPDMEREKLKKEIKQELRREEIRKKIVGTGGCLLVIALAVGLPTLYLAVQLAKTGLVEIPGLTKAFYKPASPAREVLPLYGSSTDDVYRTIGTRVTFDPSVSLATVPITEQQITTLVQRGIATAKPGSLPFPIETVQVAFDPNVVEIFLTTPRPQRQATVLVRFRPFVKGAKLQADVDTIKIGDLTVSKKVGQFLFSTFGAWVFDVVSSAIGKVGTLLNIEVDQGSIHFIVIPNPH